jgi:hypothetical protein
LTPSPFFFLFFHRRSFPRFPFPPPPLLFVTPPRFFLAKSFPRGPPVLKNARLISLFPASPLKDGGVDKPGRICYIP